MEYLLPPCPTEALSRTLLSQQMVVEGRTLGSTRVCGGYSQPTVEKGLLVLPPWLVEGEESGELLSELGSGLSQVIRDREGLIWLGGGSLSGDVAIGSCELIKVVCTCKKRILTTSQLLATARGSLQSAANSCKLESSRPHD